MPRQKSNYILAKTLIFPGIQKLRYHYFLSAIFDRNIDSNDENIFIKSIWFFI